MVGASAAGLSTVEALRQQGHRGPVTLVGAEPWAPYDRPPLSKHLLTLVATAQGARHPGTDADSPSARTKSLDGAWKQVRLRSGEELTELGVQVRLGSPAVGLEVAARRVHLADGEHLDADHVVIATGVAACGLPGTPQRPGTPPLRGVHRLRTLEDAVELGAQLRQGARLVVVGGGLVGSEAAAVAATLGMQVHLVHRGEQLLGHGLGASVTDFVRRLHLEHGVDVRLRTAVANIEAHAGGVRAVVLSDGTRLPADAVLMAVGSRPVVDWLSGSGLDLSDGVSCDATLSAAEGVYAAGDVCRWPHPRTGRPARVEHRANATEQGIHVAGRILGLHADPFAALPYYWSEQYAASLQVHGWPQGHDEAEVVHGSPEERRFVVAYRQGPRLTAVLAVRSVKAARPWRAALADGASWHQAYGELAA